MGECLYSLISHTVDSQKLGLPWRALPETAPQNSFRLEELMRRSGSSSEANDSVCGGCVRMINIMSCSRSCRADDEHVMCAVYSITGVCVCVLTE